MKRIEVYQYEEFQPGENDYSPFRLNQGIGLRKIDGDCNRTTPDLIPFDPDGKTLDRLADAFVFNRYSVLTNQVGQRLETLNILGTPVVIKSRGLSESDFDTLVHKIARKYFRL